MVVSQGDSHDLLAILGILGTLVEGKLAKEFPRLHT